MLSPLFTRVKNGFAIMYQAFKLMHQHKTFYWFAGLLMVSYAAVLGILGSCVLYLFKSIAWVKMEQVTDTALNLTYTNVQHGTVEPLILMNFIGMLITALLAHALWKNILEIAISTYAAAAMHNDQANLNMGHAVWRAFTGLWHVFCWVLFNMSVGLVIGALSGNGNKKNFSITDALRQMLGSLLSMAWSICTFLVPQVIAFERAGAIQSIKTSFEMIKKTFGESVTANFVFSLFYSAIGTMVVLSGLTLSMFIQHHPSGAIYVPWLPGVLFVCIVLSTSFASALVTIARIIFKTSIYFYAKNKECVGFDASLISQSFR